MHARQPLLPLAASITAHPLIVQPYNKAKIVFAAHESRGWL